MATVPSCWPARLLMLIFSPRALKVNLDLTSLLDNEDKKSKNKRGVLPKHATNIMRSWLFQHLMVSVRGLGVWSEAQGTNKPPGSRLCCLPWIYRGHGPRERLSGRDLIFQRPRQRGEALVGPQAGRLSLVLAAATKKVT